MSTPTVVQSRYSGYTAISNPTALPAFGSSTTLKNSIIVGITYTTNSTDVVTGVTDTALNTYNKIYGVALPDELGTYVEFWRADNIPVQASNIISVAVSTTVYGNVFGAEITPAKSAILSNSAIEDDTPGFFGPTIVTSTPSLVFVIGANGNANTVAIGQSVAWTAIGSSTSGSQGLMEYFSQADAGSILCDVHAEQADYYIAAAVALSGSGGGGGGLSKNPNIFGTYTTPRMLTGETTFLGTPTFPRTVIK